MAHAFLRHFQLDWRSLVAFRIVLALGLILDLSNRLANTAYFFSEGGMLPRALWETLYGNLSYRWTLHFLGGSEVAFSVLLVFQLALAVCLLVGYRTRLVSFLSWVLLLSLVHRNPLLYYGGDKLGPLLLLIAAFLPFSGSRGGERGEGREGMPSLITTLGAVWLFAQMIVLYAASGVSKVGGTYWQNGSALNNTLNMNTLVKPIGVWFEQFDGLLYLATILTPWAEIILPLLFLVPLWRGRVRMLALLGLLALNVGIEAMLDVGYFMFYATAGLLALLPTVFWEDLGRGLRLLGDRAFGGRWAHLGLGVGRGAGLGAGLGLGLGLGVGLGLEGTADTSSQVQRPQRAQVRGQGEGRGRGRGRGRARGRAQRPKRWRAAGVTALSLMILGATGITVATGLESMKVVKLSHAPWSWTLIRGVNMYQNWGLFKNPRPVTTWYVAKARLADGRSVDILQEGRPVTWERQRSRNALFAENSKWRVALAKISVLDAKEETFDAMGRALAKKWNHERPPSEAVQEMTVYRLSQALPTEHSRRRWREWLVWSELTSTASVR